jgi:hypothetical protein
MRLSILLALLPAVLAAPARRSEPAPLLRSRDASQLIADKYIVKFKDGNALSSLDATVSSVASSAEHIYSGAFNGLSTTLDAETLELLRNHPDVSENQVI